VDRAAHPRNHVARSIDGTQIAYEQFGRTGPAIIVVDGALCYRAFGPSRALAQHLSPHYRVYIYDRRGRGASEDTKPYSVEREIEDIEALIQKAGGRASLVGFSSGGALVLKAATRISGIEKLAVYEPPYAAEAGGANSRVDHVEALEALVSSGRKGDAVAYFMTRVVGMPEQAVASMKSAPVWPKLEALANTLAYDVRVMGDDTFPADELSAVKVPTLAIDGEQSPPPLRRAVSKVAKTIPHAQATNIDRTNARCCDRRLSTGVERILRLY
jgi:pimeloyl-ACP methyl ester carboxylesterase